MYGYHRKILYRSSKVYLTIRHILEIGFFEKILVSTLNTWGCNEMFRSCHFEAKYLNTKGDFVDTSRNITPELIQNWLLE